MAVKPKYSIISVGQKHGLPDGQTLNLIRRNRRRKLFCTERNNSTTKKGPCGEKDCIRDIDANFRSIRFVIDTENDKQDIEIFTINTRNSVIETKSDAIWCPERQWPDM